MAHPKRTRKQREEHRKEMEQKARDVVWSTFSNALKAVRTFPECVHLLAQSPGPDSPGREYYSSFAFFLEEFRVPGGASAAELTLYRDLLQRLEGVKPEARPALVARLEEAITARQHGPFQP